MAPDLPDLSRLKWVNKIRELRKDRPLMLEFFKLSCPACKAMFPKLASMDELYPDVDLICISLDDKERVVDGISRIPHLKAVNICLDPDDSLVAFRRKHSANVTPDTFLFTKDGTLAYHGQASGSQFKTYLTELAEAKK